MKGQLPIAALCKSAALTANPPSPQDPNVAVLFTAATSACSQPRYKFWLKPPGGAWSVVQDYGPGATFSWATPATLNSDYGVEVDVRDQTETAAYDVVANQLYHVNDCSPVSLTSDVASPQAPGTTVTLSAQATCKTGPANFRFWVRNLSGSWTTVRDYSTSNIYSWNTTSLPIGIYGLEVDVRAQGSSDSYEHVGNVKYGIGVCGTPNLSFASPGATGGTIKFTASTSACPSPQYRFWIQVQPPGGPWSIAQDYSASPIFAWGPNSTPTNTAAAGSYNVEVDVRDQSETVAYDAVATSPVQLVGCTSASLTANPASPQPHGTGVTLTASSSCPGTPQYRFWIFDPSGNHWSMVQDFSTSSTYAWPPSSTYMIGTYQLEVDVRDVGASASYEAAYKTTYTTS
jgi:hypothetical protein